jgi:hypothetical protein
VTRVRCRADVSEVQGQESSRHTGMACPLWPLWRLGRRRSGTVEAWDTGVLASFRCWEKVPRVEADLEAR